MFVGYYIIPHVFTNKQQSQPIGIVSRTAFAVSQIPLLLLFLNHPMHHIGIVFIIHIYNINLTKPPFWGLLGRTCADLASFFLSRNPSDQRIAGTRIAGMLRRNSGHTLTISPSATGPPMRPRAKGGSHDGVGESFVCISVGQVLIAGCSCCKMGRDGATHFDDAFRRGHSALLWWCRGKQGTQRMAYALSIM